MSKRKQPVGGSSSGTPLSSIGRKYDGVAALRDLAEADIVRTTEYRVRGEMALHTIAQARDTDHEDADASETLDSAMKLIETAQNVAGDVDNLTHEMEGMRTATADIEEAVKVMQDSSLGPGLTQRSKAILDCLAELRRSWTTLMGEDGAVTVLEVQQLRTTNAELTQEGDLLRGQVEALRSLMVATCQTRTPAANTIEGIELPEWFPRDTEKPFEVIEDALSQFGEINDKLRYKCSDMQRTGDQLSQEVANIKQQNSGLEREVSILKEQIAVLQQTEREARGNVTSVEVAALRERWEQERQHADSTRHLREQFSNERKEWFKTHRAFEKEINALEMKCQQLLFDKAKLEIAAAHNKMDKAAIDAIRKEADLRVDENQNRSKRFISKIEAKALRDISQAQAEAESAQKKFQELLTSTDLSTTITDQAKEMQQQFTRLKIQAEERPKAAEELAEGLEKSLQNAEHQRSGFENELKVEQDKNKTLSGQLSLANSQAQQLEMNIQELNEKLHEYSTKEEVWRKDRDRVEELLGMVEFLSGNLTVVVAKVEAYVEALAGRDDRIAEMEGQLRSILES